ncbi:MAG: hypothetical protein ABMA15_13625 [Vicinamibacterales bacterium]
MTDSEVAAPSSDPASTQYIPDSFDRLLIGLVLVGCGLWLQWGGVITILACHRNTTTAVSCEVDRRSSFSAVSVGRESVTGLQGARILERSNRNSPRFIIMLDTADGERRMDVSTGRDAAGEVVRSINEGVRSGEARFEVVSRVVGWDRMAEAMSLLVLITGLGVVLASIPRLRRP